MLTREEVLDALRGVIDPEVGIDIVDLGLVERLDIDERRIALGLIMTTPTCPQGDFLGEQAQRAIAQRTARGVVVVVEILDAPFWTPARMSQEAKKRLGWDLSVS